MIFARAPLRISFFGGGTDHPAWYKAHGGAVLSATINKYVCLNIRTLPRVFPFNYRIVWRINEQVSSSKDIQHPVVRAVAETYYRNHRLEILYHADVPAQTGLGSSSAFTVALLHGLAKLNDETPTAQKLAQTAIHVERDILKEAVGCQDQTSAAHGGLNYLRFARHARRNPVEVTPLPELAGQLLTLEDHCLLYFTGVQREAAKIEAGKIAHFADNTKSLMRMRNMVPTGISHLKKGDMPAFAKLLTESWELKKSLSPEVSTPAIDLKLDLAVKHGAYGGKLLGAGGGGFLLILAPPLAHGDIKDALHARNFMDFKFTPLGSQARLIGDWGAGKFHVSAA